MDRMVGRCGWCVVAVAGMLAAGCGMREVESIWRTNTITVNGVDDSSEWDHAKYIIENPHVTFGIQNDSENLYLSFSTADNEIQRQILNRGFTLWIDPKGGKKKTLGVRFPAGVRRDNPTDGLPGGQNEQPERPGGAPDGEMPSPGNMGRDIGRMPATNERRMNSEELSRMVSRVSDGILLYGFNGADSLLTSVMEAGKKGLTVALGNTNTVLGYELSIALDSGDKTPLGIETDGIVSVCLQTSALQSRQSGGTSGPREGAGGRRGSMGEPGGMGEMGGGGRGGRGGMGEAPGGSQRQTAEPLELWFNIKLAGAAGSR
jgi:hypothetical protein